jgi:hypothetical protein
VAGDQEIQTHVALFVWLISHQPAVLFSQNKPAISNQPAVLFSQHKSAPAISHQPNEQARNNAVNQIPSLEIWLLDQIFLNGR